MRKLLAIIIGSLATAVVSAGPTVTDVVAKQRYPWNGLVDITCKVTGISGTANGLIFDVAAVMPDSSNGRNVSHLWVVRDGIKLIDRTVHGNGNYQLLWDAQADLGQTTCSNMVIRVTVRDIHGKVQLWKGGPYWAETNIGAGEPWERGYYFWWGDTTGHKWENGVWTGNFMFKNGSFEDPTYPYAPFWQVMYKSDSELMSSSWVEKKSWYEGDRGITTYTLMPEHDAAQVHWGGDWHVPTFDELQDLFDRCDWRWCTTNGVNGFVVHSSDDWDKSIFLPCTGWGVGQDLLSENVYGHYWLSNSSYPDGLSGDDQVSQSLNFGRSFRRHDRHIRGYGLPIRPVQRFSNMVENAGESMPFPLDTTTSLDMIVPLVDLLLIPWNAAWIGGDANATVVIMDNGTEVKRTTGAGEFTYMPAEIGRHDLTYTTLIGDVVQDETYTANFYAKWKYKIVDGGAVITATTQKSGDVTIPDVLNGYPVKGIANDVFKGCDSLTSVTVPESVTDIGTRAFIENRNLHRIVLPVWLKGLIDESACSGNADDVEIVYIDGVGIYVNAPDMDFREPEDCLWSGDMNTSHDGIASARLKGMGQDSESSIELYLDSPGRLSFWWKASSESDGNNVFDYAYLSIDGVPQGTLNKENYSLNGVAIGGKTGWRQEVIDVVGKGSHVIRWTYAKDEIDEGDTGDDCVWLDEVEFTPLAYLSFDIAGASGTAPSEISELEGTVVTLPAQIGFEWEDHVFNGWSDGKATYAAESQYVVPASNVTLTAQWIAKRFLTFSLDGGEGQIPITIKDVPGADITLPSANGVSRGKHVFVGWSDGAMTYDAGANYRVTDASVEFKAVWKRKEAHVSIASDDVVNGGTVDTAGATISMSAWSNPSVGTPAIYYTLDGTEPTTGSTRYEEPFFVDVLGDVTVTALAVLDGCFDDEATFSFTRLPYSLCECVAMEGVNVAVGGAAPWFRVTGEGAHDGKAALRSGAIGDGESSCVEMQVRGEVEVSFWWKISSQNKVRADKHDYLAFSVDGEEALTLGGGVIDWTNATYAVTGSGRHSLRWTYIKDGADASNEDCAWLDDVVWSPTGKLCAVSFDANGGEVSECERKVREGSAIGDLPQPQRYGYIFDGWFTAVGGGDEVESDTEITDSVTYYAHWKVEITFDANGGTGGKTVTQDYGTALSAPTVTRVGYTFNGWSPAVPATVPAGGATYMAQWKVNRYAVSFDANGGEGGVTNEQDYASEIVPPEVSRTGYTFAGWLPEVEASVPASNVVYTAQWTVNQYMATFDANGGSGGKAVTQNYGTELVAPSVTRTGYTFAGWSPVVPTTISADDVTYTAQWRVNQYTVTFDANGGMGGKSVTQNYGTVLFAPIVTRKGYTFIGWAPSVSHTMPAGNTTYVAQWKKIQCVFTIKDGVLLGVKLNDNTEVTIPDSVTSIGDGVFDGCSTLISVTIPDGVTSIGHYAFEGCRGLTNVTIPDSVTSIGGYAFYGCSSLTSVTIPDSVTNIGNFAFLGCSGLTSVTIPDGVTNIVAGAFEGCSGLTHVTIPDSVTSIGGSAFSGCSGLTSVTIPDSVTSIGVGAFCDCSGLTSVTIPDSVTSIERAAFYGCSSLTSVTIPQSCVDSFRWIFDGYSSLSVVLSDSVTSIGGSAFSGCSGLTSVTIPDSVTSIGHWAFWNCIGLTSMTIPGSMTSISYAAFNGCSSLVSVTIPDSVTSISSWAFRNCSGLTSVILPNRFEGELAYSVFENCPNVVITYREADSFVVVFDANGGSVKETSRSVASGRAVVVLPTPTRAGYTFDGWWTMVSGGVQVSASTIVTEAVTYYAHWNRNKYTVTFNANGGTGGWIRTMDYGAAIVAPTVTRTGYAFAGWSPAVAKTVPAENVTYIAQWTKFPDPESGDVPVLFEEVEGEAPATAASEYNGYLYDEKSGTVKGTIQVKVGKPGKKDGKATVKATVVVGTQKITLKGAEMGKAAIASDEPTEIELVGKGAEECSVMLGAYGITGYYGAYVIDGARNIFSSKDKGDLAEANDALDKCLGSRMVIWDGGSVSISIAAKGKVKVNGTLASGAKVSATAVLLVGEEWNCVSVSAPKANLSFVLWLSLDGKTTMVDGLGDDVLLGKAGTLADGAVFSVPPDAALWSAIPGEVLTEYLPNGVPVTKKGTKWTLPKVGRITMKKGVIDVSKAGENPSGLKLTYKVKDGTFKGSFKVYAENKGKLKATTVNVTGFLLNGIGFGTATIKKVGSVSVRIE